MEQDLMEITIDTRDSRTPVVDRHDDDVELGHDAIERTIADLAGIMDGAT